MANCDRCQDLNNAKTAFAVPGLKKVDCTDCLTGGRLMRMTQDDGEEVGIVIPVQIIDCPRNKSNLPEDFQVALAKADALIRGYFAHPEAVDLNRVDWKL